MNPIWITGDGRKLDIKWMDSAHLQNAYDMTLRNGRPNYALCDELKTRSVACSGKRETPDQLIWVRAIIDSGQKGRMQWFYKEPERVIAWFQERAAEGDSVAAKVVTKAMAYRMTR